MPRTCAIDKCKRKWRETCSCCQKNLCHDHIKEHQDLNNPQLNPLVNELNALEKQLQSSNNTKKLIGDCQVKLDQWRDHSLRLIHRLYEEKCEELDRRCRMKLDEQRTQLNQIRSKINELIRQQQTNQEQANSMSAMIPNIQREIRTIEDTHFQLDIRPFNIDQQLIFIEEFEPNECYLSNLSTPFQTIDCEGEWGPGLASDQQFLLIDRHPNLCLVNQQLQIIKQSPWKFDFIRDMCWSSTLTSFILTTRSRQIYLVHQKTLATELVQTIEEQDWSSCTCSESSLYLTARREGTNLFQFNLLSSFELIKRWKPPQSCKQYEGILNTAYKNKKLAFVTAHSSTSIVQLELRSSVTLDRLWSLRLDMSHIMGQPLIRCSPLKCDEWLVVDNNTSLLVHVAKDGQMKETSKCNLSPWNAVLFGSNLLAVRTKNSVDFHKL